ncbi:uncharacterized protein M421DRAFT_93142 [Didymella exigua CBS 183.55]|uniref:Uncharacterized protein n=1 Tax=Didymella exigua CBS 183.55 TaxID=1150837 RepID=A0A6A5RHI1_9PLEO|nr:uncharacterized protein M421DRAFT_93142 [Didymella exigua CBS 183.55]KAF1927785.1 hypothetical protein M421DRAFT_93142 [Didymella exigua CBS 183.55]
MTHKKGSCERSGSITFGGNLPSVNSLLHAPVADLRVAEAATQRHQLEPRHGTEKAQHGEAAINHLCKAAKHSPQQHHDTECYPVTSTSTPTRNAQKVLGYAVGNQFVYVDCPDDHSRYKFEYRVSIRGGSAGATSEPPPASKQLWWEVQPVFWTTMTPVCLSPSALGDLLLSGSPHLTQIRHLEIEIEVGDWVEAVEWKPALSSPFFDPYLSSNIDIVHGVRWRDPIVPFAVRSFQHRKLDPKLVTTHINREESSMGWQPDAAQAASLEKSFNTALFDYHPWQPYHRE